MSSAGNRSSYLALALDARKTINALLQLNRARDPNVEISADVKSVIQGAVESLKALASGGSLFAHLEGASSYGSYEQIRTLHEVQAAMNEVQLEDRLAAVLSGADPEKQGRSRELAIRFFSALENRALSRYNGAASAYGR